MKKSVFIWEVLGIIFVVSLGALLHFIFEWSGEVTIVGLIASVNESVWEHFKQGFWPMCLYAAIEYRFIYHKVNNFLIAKAVAVYMLPIITALVFYSYTAVIGNEVLLLDILIFILAVIAAQLTSYKILTTAKLPNYTSIISSAFIVFLALVLVIFTLYPPHIPIFLDHNTGTYGIP